MANHGPVLAVLTVIGGLDTRPRLGGLVQHEELGVGTIARIESKGKVVVLFHGREVAKMCVLGILKPVSLCFKLDCQYNMGKGGRGNPALTLLSPLSFTLSSLKYSNLAVFFLFCSFLFFSSKLIIFP